MVNGPDGHNLDQEALEAAMMGAGQIESVGSVDTTVKDLAAKYGAKLDGVLGADEPLEGLS